MIETLRKQKPEVSFFNLIKIPHKYVTSITFYGKILEIKFSVTLTR